MFGVRNLSKVAAKSNSRSISSVKYVSPARSLSSIASRPVLAYAPGDRLRLKSNSYLPSATVSSLSFARFNSTSSAAGSEPGKVIENVTPELDDIMPKIEEIPERLGYLKELGLDYGWGPSAFMEWTIEHIHLLSGIPWWASIVAAAVLTRVALFKPSLMAADNQAKTAPVKDKIMLLRNQRMKYFQEGNQVGAAKSKVEMDALYKNHGITLWKSFLPMLQIPLGFGTFRVVRGMSMLPVPALATEEFAWIHDLTSYDPLYVLPVATTVFMYMTMKRGTENGPPEMQSSALRRSMIYGLPALSLLFIAWQPAALQLYFAASGVFALFQAYLINTPSLRSRLGVAPIYKPDQNIQNEAGIRLIEILKQQKTQPSSEVSGSATKTENISFIDRAINNTKKEFSSMGKEMQDKVSEYTKNNTETTKSRLTPEEKKEAEAYKAMREIDDVQRIVTNSNMHIKAYQRRVAEKPATVKSWQDIRKRAKEAAAANPSFKEIKASSNVRSQPKARK